MFIPTEPSEVKARGWDSLDIILVSGDTYIDSSYSGIATIGHWLIDNGFRVGIIAQPHTTVPDDIMRLGEPNLFWSIGAGCVDSMVANYTPTKKRRQDDDFTPGGINNRRPDRASIAYTNLIKKYSKNKKPIVLGGVEASLRRIAHYDLWTDDVRRSILFDAKADIITYGMAERSNLELAQRMRDGKPWTDIRGICYISADPIPGYVHLPSYEDAKEDDREFIDMFKKFYENHDPITAKGLYQMHANRFLVQNPPSYILTEEEIDRIYSLPFENKVHPYYAKDGKVKAMETIKQSITTHRGCYGECNFCAISVHQGRTVMSRSEESILDEVKRMAKDPNFNGIIYDVGGPTANMYGIECSKKITHGACKDRRCLYPNICSKMPINHGKQIELLSKILDIPKVKRVFVTSGIRYDMILSDTAKGDEYIECIAKDHVSGQLKIAPEHVTDEVLKMMGKPGRRELLEFKRKFDAASRRADKKQFLTYYLMAAHPGCKEEHMEELSIFAREKLKTNPEQVQIFTPTPSTNSTMMYRTRRDMEDTRNIKCEHSMQMKQRQKDIVIEGKPGRKHV